MTSPSPSSVHAWVGVVVNELAATARHLAGIASRAPDLLAG
jgi:hypothetical protein